MATSSASTPATLVGSGVPAFKFPATTGIARHFSEPQDVISSINDDLESIIAIVASGGTTFLSPILGRLGGIIALDGTLRSHLAIVSREFEVPCLVGATLDQELANGTNLRLDYTDAESAMISVVA